MIEKPGVFRSGSSRKSADPWTSVAGKYPVGTRVRGRVVSLTDYGAFVELEPGVEGLVHVSEMSWTHEVRHPSSVVAVGDQVEAAVLNVDPGSRKISLGMKQTAPNPWDMIEGKYPIGTRIEGKVKSLTDFGAFVGLEEGIDGLIHISDMSWTKHIKHPSELFKKGQKVEAVVLRIDKEKERLSLGYKQLSRDPWDERFQAGIASGFGGRQGEQSRRFRNLHRIGRGGGRVDPCQRIRSRLAPSWKKNLSCRMK